jgi:aminoglycoside phosphotransferase family enzyme/predicted kinase
MHQSTLTEQQSLVSALQLALQAGGVQVGLSETHISWVLVAGPDAYKIKKAVRLDFVDFSTLAARRHFCNEELRLNRRLAPDLYVGVVPVTGSLAQPFTGGAGAPIEYAVKMHSFAQEALWSRRIRRQLLAEWEVDALAQQLARFHAAAERAPDDSPWGTPEAQRRAAEENIAALAPLARTAAQGANVAALREWQAARLRDLAPIFAARKSRGMVRECHGDLHTGNILTIGDQVVVFDCIEFSDSLRWTDVMHDIAFAYMDLRQQGQAGLAARLLNGYLELTGDYAGVALLHYYEADCALVRAKVELLRAHQLEGGAALGHEECADRLIAAALKAARPDPPALMVMHGFSGGGKSFVARKLVELFGAVQLRSDVERKRMHGIDPFTRPSDMHEPELYSQQTTAAVYARLRELAAGLIEAGVPAVIDACSLKREERAAFEALADELQVPFLLVDVGASEATLRARIRQRMEEGADPSDADESVLELQLRVHEPLADSEQAHALAIDSELPFDAGAVRAALPGRRHGR